MVINTSTPISEALRKGYTGKAVEMMPEYPHTSVLERMRAELGQRLKLISGPLYWGEAETTLLQPLLQATRLAKKADGEAQVAREAYQLAAAYALIFDISKISQSKDIAKEVTISSVQVQPIVKAFERRVKGEGRLKDNESPMRATWSKIDQVLKSGLATESPKNDDTYITPLELLSSATSPQSIGDSTAGNVANVWNTMLENLRHGKGVPLSREDRKAYMVTMTELLMRIDKLIAQSKTEMGYYRVGVGEKDENLKNNGAVPGTAFIDAYTAMYWLNVYLAAVAEYDVIFPQSDLMVQSQAWVLTIKTQAAKLKKTYMDIAQVAMSFDVFTAIRYWEEVRNFYDPILNQSLSVVADMTSLWNDMKTRADKMLSTYAHAQADQVFSSFKDYMKADYVLPEADFAIASSVLSDFEVPAAGDDGNYFVPVGPINIEQMFTTGERVITVADRAIMIPQLAEAASAIEDAVAYAKRAREILQLSEETEDIYHALIPSGIEWKNPYSLEGTISDLKVVDFDRHDPMQVMYEKYHVSTIQGAPGSSSVIGALEWKFVDLLMRPFYKIPQLQRFASERSDESRILWPGLGELPVGDLITAQYITQPVPACYTASRNSNFVSNDMTSYLTLMSGHSGVTAASRDYFRSIASMLDKFPGTYSRGILDALAATMFVWKKPVDGSWEVLKPSCPTIYGLPLNLMLEANKVNPAGTKSEPGLKLRSFTITVESGATYQFVLHAKMPKAGEFVYFAYPYAKGVYLHIPLLKTFSDDYQTEIENALKISFSKDDNVITHTDRELEDVSNLISSFKLKDIDKYMIPVLGWAPYLINMPHLMCSYQDKPAVLMDEEYRKYAMLSVRVRYDSVERSIYVGGFVDNPVELFDIDDYSRHLEDKDPSPITGGGTVEVPDAEPQGKEPERSEAEDKPDPTTIGLKDPSNPDQPLTNAGKVTQAPVIAGDVVKVPTAPTKGEERVTTEPVDANALAGDPSKHTDGDKDREEATGEKYWKKISPSGEIEEVIKATACPDGYVPASEEEYRKFVISREKEAAAQTEKGDQ